MSGLGCAACDQRLGLGSYLGMGDDSGTDSDGMPIADPIVVSSPVSTLDCPFDPGCPGYTAPPLSPISGAAPVSSVNNTALDNALASIAAQWTKIAGQTIAPQTTITTPQGLQVQTPAGQTSALANLFAGSSLTSATGSVNFSALLPWLLIGGAGLFALKALGK